MMTKRESIRIELTTEQRQQIREFSGRDVGALDLETHELEQRIAPTTVSEISITKHTDASSTKLY